MSNYSQIASNILYVEVLVVNASDTSYIASGVSMTVAAEKTTTPSTLAVISTTTSGATILHDSFSIFSASVLLIIVVC